MYVGISETLLNAVRDKISTMRKKEISTTGTRPEVHVDKEVVERMLWGDYLDLKDKMPKQWKYVVQSVTAKMGEYGSLELNYPKSGIVAPPVTRSSGWGTPDFSIEMDINDPGLVEYKKYVETLKEINDRWDKVNEQILTFLKKCKSLNQAMKLWPQVELYIPKDYIDRINAKVDRKEQQSEAKDAVKGLDVEHLTTAAVIARMSGK